jgi:glycosyltransferase involved in cell wall biosynthesis
MVRVLIINQTIQGGLLHYGSQLANSLSKDMEVYVIGPPGIDKTYFSDKIKIFEVPIGNSLSNILPNTFLPTRPLKFILTVKKIRPDIIHFNSFTFWTTMLIPFLWKYPIVLTLHDTHQHVGLKFIDQIDYTISRALIMFFSKKIFVHGEQAKNELNHKEKVVVVHHGDFSFFTKLDTKNIEEEPNTVLFFGRIEDYKGLEYLIPAIATVSLEIDTIKCIIAGRGDFSKYQTMLSNREHFEIHNDFIPDDQIPVLFKRAKIIVLPYVEGTQSGIIPIAYAFKKPVIITSVGSIPEVVDQGITGIIIPPKDSKAISDAIIYLLRNENVRKEMGERAYDKMVKELSWAAASDKIIQVYKDILKSNNIAFNYSLKIPIDF